MIKDTSNNGSSDLYQIKFKQIIGYRFISLTKVNNRLYLGIIVRDHGTFKYVQFNKFVYSSTTTFNLLNNETQHLQGKDVA